MGIILLMHLFATEQDLSAYQKGIFGDDHLQFPYRFLSPVTEAGKKYPLVIFLHGAYEKVNDNELQLIIGGRFFFKGFDPKKLSILYSFSAMPQ